jgi:inosine-uridine nucleoside N-ribohydrolase
MTNIATLIQNHPDIIPQIKKRQATIQPGNGN